MTRPLWWWLQGAEWRNGGGTGSAGSLWEMALRHCSLASIRLAALRLLITTGRLVSGMQYNYDSWKKTSKKKGLIGGHQAIYNTVLQTKSRWSASSILWRRLHNYSRILKKPVGIFFPMTRISLAVVKTAISLSFFFFSHCLYFYSVSHPKPRLCSCFYNPRGGGDAELGGVCKCNKLNRGLQ